MKVRRRGLAAKSSIWLTTTSLPSTEEADEVLVYRGERSVSHERSIVRVQLMIVSSSMKIMIQYTEYHIRFCVSMAAIFSLFLSVFMPSF